MWAIPGNRKRVVISIRLMICQQMTATNTINLYAPQILQEPGHQGDSYEPVRDGHLRHRQMTTYAVFLLFAADSLGRRRSLLWTSIA